MTKPLAGRVALVTGAAGAIGVATARLLAERGSTLACVVRRPCPDLPSGALMVQADISDEEQVKAAVEQTVRSAGRIDILVNNAGVEGPQALIPDYDTGEFMRVLQVNVLGVFLGLKHVMPLMAAQGSGSIINLSSVAGIRGAAMMSGYVASKHAVIGLTRSAALEAAPSGVRVNAILPGFIDSRMLSDIASRLGMPDTSGLDARVPTGRLGQPEEVAQSVAFLAGDESRYMNGACLTLDGGVTVGI